MHLVVKVSSNANFVNERLLTKIIFDDGMEWKISQTRYSVYSEAITTKKETLYRGDNEAYMGLIYKKFMLCITF